MRESVKKNSEKLFLLKVCLPAVYEEIGNDGVEAVEQGWAKEQDYRFINDLVHKYVAKATEEAISYEGTLKEKMALIRTFNFFLYAFVERKIQKRWKNLKQLLKNTM